MHFHHRRGNRCDGVCQRDRSVCVSAGIQDNTIVGEAGFVQFVYQVALVIALEIMQRDSRKFILQVHKKRFEALIAINGGFAFAQKIQIWTIYDDEFHVRYSFKSEKCFRLCAASICHFRKEFYPDQLYFLHCNIIAL